MAGQSKAAQDFVPIKEVRNGVVVMKDGSMRMILMTSTINFELKSQEEQTAVIKQFQNFLNSLEYSTQILVQSRRMDITPYLSMLRERVKHQFNDLMKIQTREYIQFIEEFTDVTDVMTKSLFVIVPYTPVAASYASQKSKVSSLISRITGKEQEQSAEQMEAETFEEQRAQLEQRVNVVKQGLARTGVRAVPLGDEEIIELYYKIFNPKQEGAPKTTDE